MVDETLAQACVPALRALLSPGDEVVILAPYFVEYLFYIRNAGGVPVVAETDPRFQLNVPSTENFDIFNPAAKTGYPNL